ncbi:MAG: hypothetical protein ACJAWY_000390 [Sphingomonas echinoides]|jgi:hypothetical protein
MLVLQRRTAWSTALRQAQGERNKEPIAANRGGEQALLDPPHDRVADAGLPGGLPLPSFLF